MGKKLNDRQEMFCREYLIDLNATQAAIRAGYSPKTAYSMGQRLLKNVEAKKRTQELMSARAERNQIDADYVLQRLAGIDALDIVDILDDTGSLLPVNEWPKDWRISISGIEVQEQREMGRVVGYLKKIKLPDKVRNIELIGKHVDVQAFVEKSKMEIQGDHVSESPLNNLDSETLREILAVIERKQNE